MHVNHMHACKTLKFRDLVSIRKVQKTSYAYERKVHAFTKKRMHAQSKYIHTKNLHAQM